MPIYLLDDRILFPDPALAEKRGIVAVGGDLRPERLLLAYHLGIFPWFSKEEPITWWSPDPRFVLYPRRFKLRRSLRKVIRKNPFEIHYDKAFKQVVGACSKAPRPGQDGTWITKSMLKAYVRLHEMGYAHSIETWRNGKLVGGLYGLAVGPFFFGESMFHHEPEASKVALAALVARLRDAVLIDCQVANDFFKSMGAQDIPRAEFLKTLRTHIKEDKLWRNSPALSQGDEILARLQFDDHKT